LAVICVAVILGIGAALLVRHSSAPIDLSTGSYLSPRRALPNFSLIDQRGHAFGPAELRGRWSLLFFGYTNCPDYCPTTLAMLAAMEKQLRAGGAALRPQVVFVSVDAKRDTPAQLARYVPYFDPEFVGVTAADQPAIEEGWRCCSRRRSPMEATPWTIPARSS
jgi:protein SCO1/2